MQQSLFVNTKKFCYDLQFCFPLSQYILCCCYLQRASDCSRNCGCPGPGNRFSLRIDLQRDTVVLLWMMPFNDMWFCVLR